ncbi:hypothetical protein [Streptomyces sp. TR02-1]|uniref:hypothetical protein n=1 Tax=Streptomyces sp. TR02-1 TaxID=3385977 RepID=UPI00399F0D20
MGTVLDPTVDMSPWWRRDGSLHSFYLVTLPYAGAVVRELAGEGAVTASERAGAWHSAPDGTLTAPGGTEGLLSALDQVARHPAYTTWAAEGPGNGKSDATVTADGHLALRVPCQVYGVDSGGGRSGAVEINYRHLAALRDAVAALVPAA